MVRDCHRETGLHEATRMTHKKKTCIDTVFYLYKAKANLTSASTNGAVYLCNFLNYKKMLIAALESVMFPLVCVLSEVAMYKNNDDICRMNILVVDDDLDIGKMICTMLTKNYPTQNVLYAENAYAVSKITDSVSIDIYILDVLMPVINGIELSFMLSKRSPNHAVVLMSVCKEYELIQRCYETGAKFFIHKPLDFDKFFSNLDSLMIETFYKRFYRDKRLRHML